jgi:hypothetical protein
LPLFEQHEQRRRRASMLSSPLYCNSPRTSGKTNRLSAVEKCLGQARNRSIFLGSDKRRRKHEKRAKFL